jgi:hypothetical protein
MSEEDSQQRDKTPCIVALCEICKLLVGAAVQIPEHAKDTARFVRPWILAGLEIKTMSAAEVRAAAWCKCERKRKKAHSAATPGRRETNGTPKQTEES